jgi:hypothetical protein
MPVLSAIVSDLAFVLLKGFRLFGHVERINCLGNEI